MQPPFSFYRKIISDGNYKNIVIVTDHRSKNNPCIVPLQKSFNAKMVSIDTITDFGFLLSSPNLVLSKSNFPLSASWISKKLKNLYVHVIEGTQPIAKLQIERLRDYGINIHQYSIARYIPFKCWTASAKQIKLMLTHRANNISAIK